MQFTVTKMFGPLFSKHNNAQDNHSTNTASYSSQNQPPPQQLNYTSPASSSAQPSSPNARSAANLTSPERTAAGDSNQKPSTSNGHAAYGLDPQLMGRLSSNVVAHLHNRNAKPRALRFTWSMKTTSSMEAHLMVQEIIKVSSDGVTCLGSGQGRL